MKASASLAAPTLPILAHPADCFLFWRGLLAPAVLYAPFFSETLREHIWLYAVSLLFLIGNTNYILHLHVHRPFSRHHGVNLLLDLAMGAATGMVASNWRIQHIEGHHGGRESEYRGPFEARLNRFSVFNSIGYCLTSVWPTFWTSLVVACQRLRAKASPANAWSLTEQLLLVALFAGLALWRPQMALFYVLPWWATNFFMTRYVDFLNHFGCDERSGNALLCANNSLSPTYNFMTNNFGYHTAHHCRPSAHWTELPKIHAAIVGRIPAHNLKTYSWSCVLIPLHFVLSWRGRM